MKKHAFTIILLICSITFSVKSQNLNPVSPHLGLFGFGPITGNHPWVGATLKLWFTKVFAVDAVVGYRDDVHLQVNGTYNFLTPDSHSLGMLAFIAGAGVFSETPNNDNFGIQGKGSIEWFMPWERIGIFAEYLPAVNFNPGDDKAFQPLNFTFGIRYYM